ncbi:MAG: hypothetical protein ACRC5M_01320, partial [Anaeroplasmataceae bacterium]
GNIPLQNSVVSSTRQYIKDNLSKYYKSQTVNIEKTNLVKYIIKNNNFDIIYCFNTTKLHETVGGILDIIDKETLQLIDPNKGRVIKDSGYGDYAKISFNQLGIDLEDKTREESKILTKYKYAYYTPYIVEEHLLYEYDFDKMSQFEKNKYYDTEKECLVKHLEDFNSENKSITAKMESNNRKIDTIKNRLATIEKEVN